MELDILKLVYDYSVKGIIIDYKFVDKIIDIVVSEKNLDNYVQNVKFTNSLDKNDFQISCAAYSSINNAILIDFESIKLALKDFSYYDYLFQKFEQLMFRNLMITQFVLHELEHAYQIKQADNKSDNSVETKLLRASLSLQLALRDSEFLPLLLKGNVSEKEFVEYLLQYRKLYRQYYELDPKERIADVNSFRTIVNVIEPVKNSIPNLYEFKNASLVEAMLSGYQKSWNIASCPTQAYLSGTGKNNIWTEFDFYSQDSSQLRKNVNDQFNLERRLSLGLPISYMEYEITNKWLQSTNKFRIKK